MSTSLIFKNVPCQQMAPRVWRPSVSGAVRVWGPRVQGRGRSVLLRCICLWSASACCCLCSALQSVAWPAWFKHVYYTNTWYLPSGFVDISYIKTVCAKLTFRKSSWACSWCASALKISTMCWMRRDPRVWCLYDTVSAGTCAKTT